MALKGTIGELMVGPTCSVDFAFHRFQRQVDRVSDHPAWDCFLSAIERLEVSLKEAGGFDEQLQDVVDVQGGALLADSGTIDRYLETMDMSFALEDFAGAFVVTLQARLAAVDAAARNVYDAANQNALAVNGTCPQPGASSPVWHVANFTKHRDEWTEQLGKRESKTFAALQDLGVAFMHQTQRRYVPWVIGAAVRKIAENETLSLALRKIVADCERTCSAAGLTIQEHFATLSAELDRIRRPLQATLGLVDDDASSGT